MPGRSIEANYRKHIGMHARTVQASSPTPEHAIAAARSSLSRAPISPSGLALLLFWGTVVRNAPLPVPFGSRPGAGNDDSATACAKIARRLEPVSSATASEWHSRCVSSSTPQLATSSWLLPGADAGKGKPAAKPAQRPIKLSVPAKAATAAIRFRARAQAGLKSRQRPVDARSPLEEARSGPRIAATSGTLSNRQEASIEPMKISAAKKADKPEPARKPVSPSVVPLQLPAGQDQRTVMPLPAPAVDLTPYCRTGPPPDRAGSFYETQPAFYCVPRGDVPPLMAGIHYSGADNGTVTVPFLLRHRIAAPLRALPLARLAPAAAGQTGQRWVRASVHPLGHDEVVTLLTTRVLQEADLAGAASPPGGYALEQDSFRILRHTDLGGHSRLLLAYFVNRDGGDCNGVAAGFLEIFTDQPGEVSIEDGRHGSTFSADTLDELVEGIEHISGSHYLGPALDADGSGHGSSEEAWVVPEVAANLWVAPEYRLSRTSPHEYLNYNPDIDFFGPVRVQLGSPPQDHVLYRHAFTVDGRALVYVDEHGNVGALRLYRNRRSDRWLLRCDLPQDRALARRVGLREGQPYGMDDLVRAVRSINLLQIDSPPAAPARPVENDPVQPATVVGSRGETSTDESGAAHVPHLAPDATIAPEIEPSLGADVPTRQSYAFDPEEGVLAFKGADGTPGRLIFRVRHKPRPGYVLISDDAPALQLAARLGMAGGVVYGRDAIDVLMERSGYAQLPLAAWRQGEAATT